MPGSLHQFDRYTATDHRSRPLQAAERNVAFRIQDSVNLSAARFSSVAILFLEIFFFFMASASCHATTSLTACACASSKIALLP